MKRIGTFGFPSGSRLTAQMKRATTGACKQFKEPFCIRQSVSSKTTEPNAFTNHKMVCDVLHHGGRVQLLASRAAVAAFVRLLEISLHMPVGTLTEEPFPFARFLCECFARHVWARLPPLNADCEFSSCGRWFSGSSTTCIWLLHDAGT